MEAVREGGTALPARDDIDEAYKWRLEDIYSEGKLWEANCEGLKALLEEVETFKGRLGSSPDVLLAALKKCDEIGELLGRIYAYATMKSHENLKDARSQAMAGRVSMLAVEASKALAFVRPEISCIDDLTIERFMESEKDLEVYRFALEQVKRLGGHILPPEQEDLLALAEHLAGSPRDIFTLLTGADLTFPEIKDENGRTVKLSEERYGKYIYSRDRRVRKDAYVGLLSTYASAKNALGATLSGSVRKDLFFAKARRYPSCLEAALFPENIPPFVYEMAIELANRYLGGLHKYLRLKKRALKLDELHMYDLYAPLVPETREDIPFEEAKAAVFDGLAPLGEEYRRVLTEGFGGGWIDIYESDGKHSGAYSWGVYGVHPYVLLNYKGTLRDVFTLAHEMGHAVHSHLTNGNQPYVYSGHSIFTAEVASTVNEALLLEHFLKKARDDRERAYLLNVGLEQVRTTVWRQLLFAEFELAVHRLIESGEALTQEVFCRLWRSLNERYYAPLVIDAENDFEWSRIPHFYSAFYVYQYATGYAAATSISQAILKEGESAAARYVDFLKKGSSAYPLDLLKIAGIDLTGPVSFEETFAVFLNRLNQLESLLS